MDEKVHICIAIPLTIEAAMELFRGEEVCFYEDFQGTQVRAEATLIQCLHLIELVDNIDHEVSVRRIYNG